MGVYAIKLPDVGEGIAEAELIEWNVAVGDVVREDDVIASVMTDKANIEIPSSVSGKVLWLGADIGHMVAVGADLIRLEIDGEGNVTTEISGTVAVSSQSSACDARDAHQVLSSPVNEVPGQPGALDRTGASDQAGTHDQTGAPDQIDNASRPESGSSSGMSAFPRSGRPLAAPSVRKRAREAAVDLQLVPGSGPAGRITHDDLITYLASGGPDTSAAKPGKNLHVAQIKVVGLRRRIAEKMALANAKIPHITIVEEVDVTSLEDLRDELNTAHEGSRAKLTILPFVIKAIVEAVREQPALNAHFDDETGVINQYGGVHVGIATQTPNGLMVPVVRHTEAQSLWDSAQEILRLSAEARDGKATREDLSGSTITITSLGPLGAIATTPIINYPEVAIVGINKIAVRPWWDGQQFMPRKMMNLSCSFDHRVIDGWDAAVFVQKLKSLLERPAMLFVGS
ncbi:MAG: dihydrolipoamide acetyltransferase family protein [Hyphomicrobiaceae bacterium]